MKEINKNIKQIIKEYKKALKEETNEENKQAIESSLRAMESLLNHKNDKEKSSVWNAITRVQLLKEELLFVNMFNNLFLSNAISVSQFAEQVSMENQEEYIKRFRSAYAGLQEKLKEADGKSK